MPTIYNWIIFSGFETGNRQLSASQLHLLLNPTEEGEDESLRNSEEIVSSKHSNMQKAVRKFSSFKMDPLKKWILQKWFPSDAILTFLSSICTSSKSSKINMPSKRYRSNEYHFIMYTQFVWVKMRNVALYLKLKKIKLHITIWQGQN